MAGGSVVENVVEGSRPPAPGVVRGPPEVLNTSTRIQHSSSGHPEPPAGTALARAKMAPDAAAPSAALIVATSSTSSALCHDRWITVADVESGRSSRLQRPTAGRQANSRISPPAHRDQSAVLVDAYPGT
jgi:hypothetical protein